MFEAVWEALRYLLNLRVASGSPTLRQTALRYLDQTVRELQGYQQADLIIMILRERTKLWEGHTGIIDLFKEPPPRLLADPISTPCREWLQHDVELPVLIEHVPADVTEIEAEDVPPEHVSEDVAKHVPEEDSVENISGDDITGSRKHPGGRPKRDRSQPPQFEGVKRTRRELPADITYAVANVLDKTPLSAYIIGKRLLIDHKQHKKLSTQVRALESQVEILKLKLLAATGGQPRNNTPKMNHHHTTTTPTMNKPHTTTPTTTTTTTTSSDDDEEEENGSPHTKESPHPLTIDEEENGSPHTEESPHPLTIDDVD